MGQHHEASLPGGAGLYDYGARWYAPRIGRFLSPGCNIAPPNFRTFCRLTAAQLCAIFPSGATSAAHLSVAVHHPPPAGRTLRAVKG